MRISPFPMIWILDEDPLLSSACLIDRDVSRNINNAYQLLINTYLLLNGVRSSRILNFIYDDSDRKIEFMDKAFPNWPPIDKLLPRLKKPVAPETKFTKQCLNHFSFVKSHFFASLNEYSFRFNKDHKLYDINDWIDAFPPPYLKMLELQYINYPQKCLPFRYRQKNIVDGMRKWYKRKVDNPMVSYNKRSVPDWFHIRELDSTIF